MTVKALEVVFAAGVLYWDLPCLARLGRTCANYSVLLLEAVLAAYEDKDDNLHFPRFVAPWERRPAVRFALTVSALWLDSSAQLRRWKGLWMLRDNAFAAKLIFFEARDQRQWRPDWCAFAVESGLVGWEQDRAELLHLLDSSANQHEGARLRYLLALLEKGKWCFWVAPNRNHVL